MTDWTSAEMREQAKYIRRRITLRMACVERVPETNPEIVALRAGADALDALARVRTRLDRIEELNADRIPADTKDASADYWAGAKDASDYAIQAVRLAITRDPHGDLEEVRDES